MIGEVRPTRETMPVPRTLGGDMEQNELRRPARARTGQSTSDLLACCWIRIRKFMELPNSRFASRDASNAEAGSPRLMPDPSQTYALAAFCSASNTLRAD